MIVSTIKVDSMVLHMPVELRLAMPFSVLKKDRKYRLLIALHCAMTDGSFFFEKLHMLDYVDKYELVVIAPSLGNYFFMNSSAGKFADFLDHELFPMLTHVFPVLADRDNHYLLGISMGAFGAFQWYLRHPEYFRKAFLISGYYDHNIPYDEKLPTQRLSCSLSKIIHPVMEGVVKEQGGGYDLYKSIDDFPYKKDGFVEFYCGDKDLLTLNQNIKISDYCRRAGIKITFHKVSGGHDIAAFKEAVDVALNRLDD